MHIQGKGEENVTLIINCEWLMFTDGHRVCQENPSKALPISANPS